MKLIMKYIRSVLLLAACLLAIIPAVSTAAVLNPEVVIDNNNFVVVSSRRVGRTASEYTLRAVVNNTGARQFTNVTATLTSIPANISIVDGSLNFGSVSGNANITSTDVFVIRVDLRVKTSFDDLIWQVNGDVPVVVPPGPEQTGIFMSIDDNEIKGEVTSKSHKNWIELLGWTEGSSQSGSLHIGGGGAGKVNIQDLSISKYLDSSSPLLRLAVAEGRIFSEAKIDIIKSCGGRNYTQYAITLTPALLTSISAGGSGGEDRLTENASINFSRIETMYTPVGPDCRLETPIYSYQDINL